MASGENFPVVDPARLPAGTVVTSSGRVSGAIPAYTVAPDSTPFTAEERVRMDRTLTEATRRNDILWTVRIGDLGPEPDARARELLSALPQPHRSVLIAVSPNDKTIEIIGGDAVADRFDDRVAQLGVSAALASFKLGDLIDGLVSAVRVMSAAVSPVTA